MAPTMLPHREALKRLQASPPKPKRRRDGTLPPLWPSPAIEAEYRARLDALVEAMGRSVARWVPAAYRRNEPEVAALMAQDDSPAATLQVVIRRLARYWQRKFNDAAADLARHFAEAVARRSDLALRKALRDGGLSVRFTMSAPMRDTLTAAINENVSLIRSIPSQHFVQIEGDVMRSVAAGRDLGYLSDRLRHQFGVTKRRAALISRDQNNKATATVQRVRHVELGLTEAIWLHSNAGKEPRPTHLRAGRDKVRFDIREGWFDPAERRHIQPGELINCRCTSRPVVPGFS